MYGVSARLLSCARTVRAPANSMRTPSNTSPTAALRRSRPYSPATTRHPVVIVWLSSVCVMRGLLVGGVVGHGDRAAHRLAMDQAEVLVGAGGRVDGQLETIARLQQTRAHIA